MRIWKSNNDNIGERNNLSENIILEAYTQEQPCNNFETGRISEIFSINSR